MAGFYESSNAKSHLISKVINVFMKFQMRVDEHPKKKESHGVMVFEHSEMVRTYDTRFWDGLKIMNLVFDGLIIRWLMRHHLVTLIKTIFR